MALISHNTAIPFTQMPDLPSANLEGRSSSLRQRLRNMHEMLIAYEDKIAAVPMEAIVLNATVAKDRVRFIDTGA
jgi:hypothetical protein